MLALMLTTWRQQHLPELVATLATRPGHEAVRTLVADILRYGFGVAYHAIDHEVRLPEVHGRADTLFSADAVTLIHNASRGYPRAINNLAVNALTSAFARNSTIVDEKAARIAISETGAD